MMKRPLGFIEPQDLSDVGINPFAVKLLAESFADKPEKFGDRTVIIGGIAHNGTPVYMIVSTQVPKLEQFKDWPE